MSDTQYPLAVPDELLDEVRTAASETHLSMADVMRRSMKLGLTKLREQHRPELKPFTKAESRAAFASDPEWERLEGAMARRRPLKPESD